MDFVSRQAYLNTVCVLSICQLVLLASTAVVALVCVSHRSTDVTLPPTASLRHRSQMKWTSEMKQKTVVSE